MRFRSLAIDKNDGAILQQGRRIDEGANVKAEFHQPCPMFFTREGASLSMEGSYRGAGAFLIAAGPSFVEVDKAPLGSVWTMALNNAIASWRSNANCTVDEPSRFSLSMWLDPRVQKFVPMGHFEKPLWDNRLLPGGNEGGENVQQWEQAPMKVGDCPNVIGYRRNEKFHAPRFLYEETVNWGNHKKYGGGRSVLLAALRILFLLGFRRVYLLGVDFEMTPERKYHFSEERSAAAIQNNQHTYGRLQQWLGEVQPYFLKEKFVVKNCNLASKLTAFPFLPYEEAIEEATAHLGDYTRERTEGMYQKLEVKTAGVQPAAPSPAAEEA